MSAKALDLRKQVLQIFKSLHRTRLVVFNNDAAALEAAKTRINSDFKKNKNVSNTAAVEELLNFAQEVEKELRLSVIQAEEIKPGRFQLKLRPENHRLDNVPFNECASKSDENSGIGGRRENRCK